jgi:hypothetical protein
MVGEGCRSKKKEKKRKKKKQKERVNRYLQFSDFATTNSASRFSFHFFYILSKPCPSKTESLWISSNMTPMLTSKNQRKNAKRRRRVKQLKL